MHTNNDERFSRFICPTCKWEITSPTMHGWLKGDFGPHTGWKTQLNPCPTCSSVAYAQRKAAEVDKLLGTSHIPFYAMEWSFSSLPRDIDSRALSHVVAFCNRKTDKRGVYLFGDVGGCKTGMVISVVQAVMRRGEDAAFLRSIDLMNRLRESIHKGSADGDDLLHLAQTVTWLALDDLATERPTPYVVEQLYALVEARRAAGLYTMFTSNLSLRDLETHWRPDGMQPGAFHPGRRVVERIAEYCQGVRVGGRNLRKTVDSMLKVLPVREEDEV